jgi:hypothetical protein
VTLSLGLEADLGPGLRVALLAGGGLDVARVSQTSGGATTTSEWKALPQGTAELSTRIDAGPGALEIRAQAHATPPGRFGALRGTSLAGGALLVGYRLGG